MIPSLLLSLSVLLCLLQNIAVVQAGGSWFLIQHYTDEDCSTENTFPSAEIFWANECYNTSSDGKTTSRLFRTSEPDRIDLYPSADCSASGGASASLDIIPGACMKELKAKLLRIPSDGAFDGSDKYGPVSIIFDGIGCSGMHHFQLETQGQCQISSNSTSVVSTVHVQDDMTTIVQYQNVNCSSDAGKKTVTRFHGRCFNDYNTQTSVVHASVTTAFDVFSKFSVESFPFKRFTLPVPPDKDWVTEGESQSQSPSGFRRRAWLHIKKHESSSTCGSAEDAYTEWILEAFECYQINPGMYIQFGFSGVTTYSKPDCSKAGVLNSTRTVGPGMCLPIGVETDAASLEVMQTGITEDNPFQSSDYAFIRVVEESNACVLSSGPKYQLMKRDHCFEGPSNISRIRFETYSSHRYIFDVFSPDNSICAFPYVDGYLLEYGKCYEYEDQGMVALVQYHRASEQLYSLFKNTSYQSVQFPFAVSSAILSSGASVVVAGCITLLVSIFL